MNTKIRKTVCLLCCIFLFSNLCLSQENFPEIKLATINNISKTSEEKHVLYHGVQTFGNGIYTDSLINYIDTIYHIDSDKQDYLVYKAVWNNDTLTYRTRPSIVREYMYDYKNKKKAKGLEVESRIPPYNRFSAIIEGLDESQITALTDSMLKMKSSTPVLLNNYQTCIFYALEALFRSNHIYPEPIITRNTTFRQGEELNAFFDYFLTKGDTYQCRYKEIKKKTFPDNCVLAFFDDYGNIIHAVFHENGVFHTKNGMFAPIAYSTLKSVMESYGRWDTKHSGLNKMGKRMKGHQLAVYTLNKELFR